MVMTIKTASRYEFLGGKFRMERDKRVVRFIIHAVSLGHHGDIFGVVGLGNGAGHACPVAPFLQIEITIIFERL
jgi:hypothetical protein